MVQLHDIMNAKVFVFVYFLLIVKVKAANKIGSEVCALDNVLQSTETKKVSQADFKKKFESSSGFGLRNILKWEYGHYIPYLSDLKQMCYCVSTKVYSFTGEKFSIEFEKHYRYWRQIPYFGWQSILNFADEAIKCKMPDGSYFFIVETEKYYKAKQTHDLFVLEVVENDLQNENIAQKTGYRTYISYPNGQFKAYISRVDLTELA